MLPSSAAAAPMGLAASVPTTGAAAVTTSASEDSAASVQPATCANAATAAVAMSAGPTVLVPGATVEEAFRSDQCRSLLRQGAPPRQR